MVRLNAFLFMILVLLPISASAETYLLMAEEEGCYWCEKWDTDIAHIYPKTTDGKAAPLRRYNLHSGAPKDIVFAKSVQFTPTFILIKDGVEIDRLEGYPGEVFFWGLLSEMLERAQATPVQTQ